MKTSTLTDLLGKAVAGIIIALAVAFLVAIAMNPGAFNHL